MEALKPDADRCVLVARQPILDAAGALRGHELLFRGPRRDDGTILDGRRATAQVLVATFLDLGVADMAGGVPAWVNVTRDFLLQVDPLPLPADRVVLELLEDCVVDDALLARLDALAAQGFALALDDFVWRADRDPLVDLASYVKLDVRALGVGRLQEECARLRGRGVRVVAEKVETAGERDACLAAGADLLQGFFFAQPEPMPGRVVPSAAIRRLHGAARFSRRLSFEEVERAIMVDPGLSVGVLRLLNTAGRELPHRVSSVRQALVLLGAHAVQQWAFLLALCDVVPTRGAVLAIGLLRARLCELLARSGGRVEPDAAFAAGMLSVVDGLLGVPMADALRELPLDEELCDALLRRTGPLGSLLARACAAERGEHVDERALREALVWTDATLAEMGLAHRAAPALVA